MASGVRGRQFGDLPNMIQPPVLGVMKAASAFSARTLTFPSAETGRSAIAAFERYGRGRHRAALNMSDCFAYACARELDLPILFKGNDFAQTDIAIA